MIDNIEKNYQNILKLIGKIPEAFENLKGGFHMEGD